MIDKNTLSLAGEYGVASLLCSMDIEAHVTLGHAKRTDIVALPVNHAPITIEVKSKQTPRWPAVKGPKAGGFLVLVDYFNKKVGEHPDSYVLNFQDWKNLVNRECTSGINAGACRIETGQGGYVPIWVKKNNKGLNISHKLVHPYKEPWESLLSAVGLPGHIP